MTKPIKETRLAVIMNAEMGFNYDSFFAMGESFNVPAGSAVSVLDVSKELDRSFVAHTTPYGLNLYGWVNSSYLGG